MAYHKEINDYLGRLKKTIDNLKSDEIDQFIEIINKAYAHNKQVFVIGNGGSALTASHYACDLNKGISYNRAKRFRAIALADNYATTMAYANDVSYEDIFVEQLKNFLEKGDVVICISGSGNSKNVLKAIEYANQGGAITVGITGYDGGELKKISSHSVNANVNDMQISEDIHMILGHLTMKVLMDALDKQTNE